MGEHWLSPEQIYNFTNHRKRVSEKTLDDNLTGSRPKPPNDSDRSYSPPATDLGTLTPLPTELLFEILPILDLRSLANFRRVNRRAAEIVDSLPQYKALTKHAPDAMLGIIRIATTVYISCQTLYTKLCTPACEQCGDFGRFVYLLTCKRVCFRCFTTHDDYHPLPPGLAGWKFGLDPATVEALPRIKMVPGIYCPVARKMDSSLTLVDGESVRMAGIARHGSLQALEDYAAEVVNARHRAETLSGGPDRSLPHNYFDGTTANRYRFAAIVRVPWLNRASQELEWGFSCIACPPFPHQRRLFSIASFHEHIRAYGMIEGTKHRPSSDIQSTLE